MIIGAKSRTGEENSLILDSILMRGPQEKYRIDLKILKTKPEVGEGIFECKRCRSKNVQHTSKQTRSADEPETIFLSCTNCGITWREG